MEPSDKAAIIPSTAPLLFLASFEGLEPEPEPELEPEVADDLDPLAVPVADPAEEVGATETRFLTVLQEALESAEELV